MDAEGFELKILKGASGMLAAERIDGIQWEFAYNNVYSRVFFRDFYDLLSPRYHLFRLVKDGLYPLSSAVSVRSLPHGQLLRPTEETCAPSPWGRSGVRQNSN